jgi:hypothetical protein
MEQIYKYPRTQHIEGSRFQAGDEDLESVPFNKIVDRDLVVEEKVDGANSGISFSPSGQMRLQSRGHYLTGGPREKHFALFKQWAYTHTDTFWQVLGSRYILYGEWMYAKHTVFYNSLPHYFLEYDIWDLYEGNFLSTQARSQLLKNLPIISVPVLFSGRLRSRQQLEQLLQVSNFIEEGYLEQLEQICRNARVDVTKTLAQTDRSDLMEGLYIKVEEGGIVTARYKYVRPTFLNAILQSEGHWLDRPIIPNLLQSGSIFRQNLT